MCGCLHYYKKLLFLAGLAFNCPDLPPIYQIFCGDVSQLSECIVEDWVCDGTIDCSTGFDESNATCQRGWQPDSWSLANLKAKIPSLYALFSTFQMILQIFALVLCAQREQDA